MNAIFFIIWFVSFAMSVIIGAAAITYIRRTWQLIRSENDDPTSDRLLDGIDRLETQLFSMSERLARMEERMDALDGAPEARLLADPSSEEE